MPPVSEKDLALLFKGFLPDFCLLRYFQQWGPQIDQYKVALQLPYHTSGASW